MSHFGIEIIVPTATRPPSSTPGVTGTILEGQSIVINALSNENFGSQGPTVKLFEDFAGGTIDAITPLDSPKIGTYIKFKIAGQACTFKSGGRSHDRCGDANGSNKSRVYYESGGFTEFLISYASGIPNQYFPGASTPNTFPSVSSFKGVWVYDGYAIDGYQTDGKTDLCLPTKPGSGNFHISGNDDGGYDGPSINQAYWSFDNWTRNLYWLKDNETTPGTGNGIRYAQLVSPDKGMLELIKTDEPNFDSASSAQYEAFQIPGWRGNGDNTNCELRIDDIYLAIGAGAAARVEIGDNATYASCTDLAICTPTSWTNSSITCTVRSGLWWNDVSLAGKYLHVHNSTNDHVTSRLIS